MRGHKHPVISVAFSPDGCWVVSGSWDNIIIWDITSCVALIVPSGNPDRLQSVAFGVDGRHVLSKSQDETILYDAVSGCRLGSVRVSDDISWDSAVICPDNLTVKLGNDRTVYTFPHTVYPECCTTHKMSLAVGTADGDVWVIHFPPALLLIALYPACSLLFQ